MTACSELLPEIGAKAACAVMGVSRATYYRHNSPVPDVPKKPRPSPRRALTPSERQAVLDMLHSPRFIDKAPAEAYATLLDEGTYLCSIRTMYRILAGANEVRERRNQAKHPKYVAPELLATGPNQVWSWDITKLKGPGKWNYLCLYVIMDIYSRYVVGWMVADRESSTLASRLIYESARKQGIEPGQLTIHADRGSSMRSKPVALLMSDLGITKSHSRPHVSDDNPYSESQFKTLKYCPTFPERFGSIEDARLFCQDFFGWYNNEHRHWGIGLMTPDAVHHGKATKITEFRKTVLTTAFMAHPERFVKGKPMPPAVPEAAWINKPKPSPDETDSIKKGA
jgi:putative transposase